jgi:hypothetical protein
MPKDYKDAPSPRAESRLNHPLLLGMIIGLLLGIVISLAVALWLNRLSNPFVDKGRVPEPVSKIAPAQPAPPPEAARNAEKAAKAPEKGAPEKGGKPGERPRFEFYSILPGESEATDRDAKGKPKAAAPAPPSAMRRPRLRLRRPHPPRRRPSPALRPRRPSRIRARRTGSRPAPSRKCARLTTQRRALR